MGTKGRAINWAGEGEQSPNVGVDGGGLGDVAILCTSLKEICFSSPVKIAQRGKPHPLRSIAVLTRRRGLCHVADTVPSSAAAILPAESKMGSTAAVDQGVEADAAAAAELDSTFIMAISPTKEETDPEQADADVTGGISAMPAGLRGKNTGAVAPDTVRTGLNTCDVICPQYCVHTHPYLTSRSSAPCVPHADTPLSAIKASVVAQPVVACTPARLTVAVEESTPKTPSLEDFGLSSAVMQMLQNKSTRQSRQC